MEQQANIGNFACWQNAIGAYNGKVSICWNDSRTAHVQTMIQSDGTVDQISLKGALEKFDQRPIDLAKIDCEGAEWDLLSVPEPWLAINNIVMEYHLWNGRSLLDMLNLLASCGYKVVRELRCGEEFGMIWAHRADIPESKRLWQ